ncbi:MAG: NAD+ synthase [Halanaerobiales bacterium]
MKVTMVQINPTVGDIEYNLSKVKEEVEKAALTGTDLVVFPELSLIGYPPRDLLHKKSIISKIRMAVADLIEFSKRFSELGIIVGVPVETRKDIGKGLYNAALFISNGGLLFQQNKSLLPTYDVFDETRYFDSAEDIDIFEFKGERLGITVCEDIWNDPDLWEYRYYQLDPVDILVDKGATIIINISASPFQSDKEMLRKDILKNYVKKHKIPFVYVNQIGGNDELIFDGQSLAVNDKGVIARLAAFSEDRQTIDTCSKAVHSEESELTQDNSMFESRIELSAEKQDSSSKQNDSEQSNSAKPDFSGSKILPGNTINTDGRVIAGNDIDRGDVEKVHQALVLGIKDYFRKCGFSRAVIGLSGGIDSAVTLCLAVEALGADNVLAISMPGPYSSEGSVEDSRELASNLGIEFKVISIEGIYDSYLDTLDGYFGNLPEDVTEENIQARARGNILMAFSNKYGYLVLATGNKSELAVGYCTLYGDMSGGMSVLSDVPKTMVYQLAEDINKDKDTNGYKEIIPEKIISKAPSAELAPDQKDEDTLPPYEILDKILYYYVDRNISVREIVARGFDEEMVLWIAKKVDNNEYKRRQAAPGLKVTTRAFGMGRRMPVAARIEY